MEKESKVSMLERASDFHKNSWKGTNHYFLVAEDSHKNGIRSLGFEDPQIEKLDLRGLFRGSSRVTIFSIFLFNKIITIWNETGRRRDVIMQATTRDVIMQATATAAHSSIFN